MVETSHAWITDGKIGRVNERHSLSLYDWLRLFILSDDVKRLPGNGVQSPLRFSIFLPSPCDFHTVDSLYNSPSLKASFV